MRSRKNHSLHSLPLPRMMRGSTHNLGEITLDAFKILHTQCEKSSMTIVRSQQGIMGDLTFTRALSPAYHNMKFRRLPLLCTILSCTDDRCAMAPHTLLTDTTESQGRSAVLIRILNRLGVCASTDTLSRFIQYNASTFRKNKMKYFSSDSFTVVSATILTSCTVLYVLICSN